MQCDWMLPPQARTVPAILERQQVLFGARDAVTIPGAHWRHNDMVQVAAGRAAALSEVGIVAGDRVAVMCGNRAEMLEMVLGCAWLGAVVVPLNYFLQDSGARLLVIEAMYLERLAEVDLNSCAMSMQWVVGASAECLLSAGQQRWPIAAEGVAAAPVLPADPFAVLYTSGTTGPSKGVVCSHAHYYWWGAHTADMLNLDREDVLCTTLPLFHINALHTYLQAALSGAKVTYLERFSASGFWPAMQASQATVIYLLGAMVPFLLAQPPSESERTHRVRTGLGPGVPEQASRAFEARSGVLMLEAYGATESSLVIACAPDSPRRGVMGWLREGFQARVVDEHDHPVPDGHAGELLLRADEPYAFASGYLGKPEQTVEAWRNLWFHTGDRVIRDPDGAFRFVDRLKDAIRRRGENISSWEVEQVLLSHPDVAACAVYPVRSEHAEDEVMAAVMVRPGCTLQPGQLASFCDGRMQKYAVPRYIEMVDALPRTESGKVQKFRLRERGVPPGCWDRSAHELEAPKCDGQAMLR
jgi:crotonobetaine/carnitine-CoA ligase